MEDVNLHYCAVVPATGEVVQTFTVATPEEGELQNHGGCVSVPANTSLLVRGEIPSNRYMYDFAAREYIERPKLTDTEEYTITADGIDEVVIDLPVKTQIHVIMRNTEDPKQRPQYLSGEAEDEFRFTTVYNRDYEVKLIPEFPYQTQTIWISANAF